MYSKSIGAETAFTKAEMNNDRKVNFLQNLRCVKKESRLELYSSFQTFCKKNVPILTRVVEH